MTPNRPPTVIVGVSKQAEVPGAGPKLTAMALVLPQSKQVRMLPLGTTPRQAARAALELADSLEAELELTFMHPPAGLPWNIDEQAEIQSLAADADAVSGPATPRCPNCGRPAEKLITIPFRERPLVACQECGQEAFMARTWEDAENEPSPVHPGMSVADAMRVDMALEQAGGMEGMLALAAVAAAAAECPKCHGVGWTRKGLIGRASCQRCAGAGYQN